MVNTKVVISGEDINTFFISSNEVVVSGKLVVSIFIRGDCVDMVYFVSPTEPNVETVSFYGTNITITFKSSHVVVLSGDVESMNFIGKDGNVVKTYKVDPCGERDEVNSNS